MYENGTVSTESLIMHLIIQCALWPKNTVHKVM